MAKVIILEVRKLKGARLPIKVSRTSLKDFIILSFNQLELFENCKGVFRTFYNYVGTPHFFAMKFPMENFLYPTVPPYNNN